MVYHSKEELIKQYKENHNHFLKRYLNGCEYIANNKSQTDKWLPEVLSILDNLNLNLQELMELTEVTDKEILEGFIIR